MSAPRRIPVLIVSGFLGSGKTTLVRRLLAQAQERGLRAAVVSNEFGELGIDAALLGGGTEEFVELAGGCVCCALSDELVETLEKLHARVDPDLIVIETSGVALPFDAQLNLYRPPVNEWVGDEAVVVVVDADRGVPAGDDEVAQTWESQVGSADLLVLSKVDLVDEPAAGALEVALGTANEGAPRIRAVRGDVPFDLLFPQGPRPAADDRGHQHDHDHDHAAFVSEELRAPDGLTAADALDWLTARRGLRTKGFVRTDGGVRVVQGVGRRMELVDPGPLPVPDGLVGRIVVIRTRGA